MSHGVLEEIRTLGSGPWHPSKLTMEPGSPRSWTTELRKMNHKTLGDRPWNPWRWTWEAWEKDRESPGEESQNPGDGLWNPGKRTTESWEMGHGTLEDGPRNPKS